MKKRVKESVTDKSNYSKYIARNLRLKKYMMKLKGNNLIERSKSLKEQW